MSDNVTHATAAPQATAMTSLAAALRLQRKCACGTGKCAQCQKKKGLQAKLEIGASDDHFEREADRAADRVMNGAHASDVPAAPMQLQRVSGGASGLGEAPADVQQVLSSPGSALDGGSRSFFESRFGHDFSRVRVHHDVQADASARAVGAKAYTVGSDVVFASGAYAPHSHAGRQLMAHELAHVVQQGQGRTLLQRKQKAPACLVTEAHSPGKDQKAKVLSNQEIAQDVSRRNALDTVGEAGVRVFSSPSWKDKEGPREIAAGTEVVIAKVVKAATVCKGTGAVHPTGSGFYKIVWGTASGYVFSPVLEDVEEAPAKPSLKIDLTQQVCQAPDRLIVKKPLSFTAIGQQAEEEFKAGASPLAPKLRKTLEGSLDGDLERAMKIWGRDAPPPVYSIPLPMGVLDAQKEIKRQARENVFLIPPWADVQYYTVPDLMPGERTMSIVIPFPKLLEDYQDAMLAPSRESALSKYFGPEVGKAVVQAQDMATAKRIANVTKMLAALDALGPEPRARFDRKAMPEGVGAMTGWAEFEEAVTAHLARERAIARQAAATPGKLTGGDLDAIVHENEGVTPETDEIAAQGEAMTAERDKRRKKRDEWANEGKERAKELRDGTAAHLNLEGQKNLLGQVFTMGIFAGAQYEIPSDDWADFQKRVSDQKAEFSGGIVVGLIPGALDGVVEAFKGIIDLAELLAAIGGELFIEPLVDVYDAIKDSKAFEAKKKAESEALRAKAMLAAKAVWGAFNAFLDDPAFLADPAFDIGESVGRLVGKTMHDKLLSPSVKAFDKGYVVGEVIGRVIIEIVMLVFAPETLLGKAGAKTGVEAAKAAKAMEGLASKVSALDELRKLKTAGKAADEIDEARKLRDALELGEKGRDAAKLEDATDAARDAEKLKDAAKAEETGKAAQVGPEAEKVRAVEPLGDGHHIEVSGKGVCLCSPPPCPKMRTKFVKELEANPGLDKELLEAELLYDKDPRGAAKKAEAVYDKLKALARSKQKGPPKRRGLEIDDEDRQMLMNEGDFADHAAHAPDTPGRAAEQNADRKGAGLTEREVWKPPKGARRKPSEKASSEDKLDWLMERLQMHVDEAKDRYVEIGLTPAQEAAVDKNANLLSTYRGERIDNFAKSTIQQDPDLADIMTASDWYKEPDIFPADPKLADWLDITTPEDWVAHVKKYKDRYGDNAKLLPTRPPKKKGK